MSRIVAQFDPSAGSGSFQAGAVNRCSALWVMNESLHFLQFDFGAADTPKIIQPWSNKLLHLTNPVQTVNWSIVATLQADNPPASVVFVEGYDPSEDISALISGPLSRQTNVGNNIQVNSAATTIEQDLFTPFVYGAGSLVATKDSLSPNQLDVTAGVAFPQQSDGSLLRTAMAPAHFLTILATTTYFLDLNPDGSWSWTTSHSAQPNYLAVAQVTTDGSGNILTVTDERVLATVLLAGMTNNPGAPGVQLYNLHVTKDIQADDQISVQGIYKVTSGANGNGYTIYIGSNDALYFMPTGSTQNQGAVFYYWVPGMGALPIFSLIQPLGAVYIDANGVIHAPSPVQLISGHQETGDCGVQAYNTVGNGNGVGVNFKTTLTNTPTSITLSQIFQTNTTGIAASLFRTVGFWLSYSVVATGQASWIGTYTTVGNCLIAVDAAARTFDHHCDVCGHLNVAAPFTALTHSTASGVSLTFTCPACGAVECFNPQLTSADEADTAPQGSGQYVTTRGAQATLIRQLMTALGLEVAA